MRFLPLLFMFSVAEAQSLLFEPTSDFTAVAHFSAADVKEDLQLLKSAVQLAYAGPPSLLAALDSFAPAVSDSEALCLALAEAFEQVADSHLAANIDFNRCGANPVPGHAGANINDQSKPWVIEWRRAGSQPVAVVGLAHFADEADREWEGFLSAIQALHAQGKPFIIDLRGNSGGDDSMGIEMARVLYGLARDVNVPAPIRGRTWIQTPEAFALQANDIAYQNARSLHNGRTPGPYQEVRRQRLLEWMKRAKAHAFPSVAVETYAEVPVTRAFAENIYVLIDKRCASACENTLQALEKLPHRVLVGENSRGMVEYGELGRVRLPNSHVVVSLSTMRSEFRDRRNPEKIGYSPDQRVPENEDALAAALQRIKQNN